MKVTHKNRYVLLGVLMFLINITFSSCKNGKVEELIKQAKRESKEDNHLKAKDLFTQGLLIDPDNITCLRERAWEEVELKDYKNALIDENKVLQLDPKLTAIYVARAVCELRLYDTNAAISDYKQVLKIDSGKGEGYCGLGDIALFRKDTATAINFFADCKRHDTTNREAYGEMGWIEFNRKLYNEAEKDIRKELKLAIDANSKGEKEMGYRTLGLIKIRVHDTMAALRAFTSAIEDGNAVPIDYYYKGLIELELKDTNAAFQDCVDGCKSADSLGKNEWRPLYLKSEIEYERHQYKLSFIDAEKEIKMAPDNKNGYYRRGLAHVKLGNKNLGCEDFYKAKELGSKWADSVINLYCR